jgi:hypothetical protein
MSEVAQQYQNPAEEMQEGGEEEMEVSIVGLVLLVSFRRKKLAAFFYRA